MDCRRDREDQAHLFPASEPGVRATKVALGERFDVIGAALSRRADDAAADRVVAGWPVRVGHGQSDPRIAFDVAHFLEARNRVDQDVATVGVHPRLGELR